MDRKNCLLFINLVGFVRVREMESQKVALRATASCTWAKLHNSSPNSTEHAQKQKEATESLKQKEGMKSRSQWSRRYRSFPPGEEENTVENLNMTN